MNKTDAIYAELPEPDRPGEPSGPYPALRKHYWAEQSLRNFADRTHALRLQVGQMESVLVDGVAYPTPAPIAAEMLRLHLELLQHTKCRS